MFFQARWSKSDGAYPPELPVLAFSLFLGLVEQDNSYSINDIEREEEENVEVEVIPAVRRQWVALACV